MNNTDVSNMGHTEVVNLVRAAPRVVDLVVGRVLEAPKPPIEAHLLPDICFKGSQEPLGKKQLSLTKPNIPGTSVCAVFRGPASWSRNKSFKSVVLLFVVSPGLVLDGGGDSVYGVLFVKDILPDSMAFSEGSLKPLDLIHYINGAPTQDLTLSESTRLLEFSLHDLTLKATR